MNNQIKLKRSRIDFITEIIGQTLLWGLWLYTLYNYNNLPNRIPTHYSGLKADSYGHKSHLFTLLIILTLFYIGFSILERFPHKLNYAVEVTDKNRQKVYLLGIKMIRTLKIIITLILGFAIANKQQVFNLKTDTISPLFYVFCFTSLIGSSLYFIIKMGAIASK